jgi:hypothetical protein
MIAPEQVLRAYLNVLNDVLLFVRLRSRGDNRLSDEHLFDLMNAVHNVPELLTRHGEWFTAEMIRNDAFADYDSKWANNGGLSLVRMIDEAMSRH